MPPIETDLLHCDECGAVLKSGTSKLGCLNCLLLGGPNEPGPETRRFQHYEICCREDGVTLDELGRGAMGITYRAQDLNLGSPVALKVINVRYSGDPETRERFRREARAAAQLRHPNVAGVFHFGETEAGRCFYAMELIEGETIEAHIRQGAFDDQNIRDVWFWGGYATMPFHPLHGIQLEFYYLGLSNPHAVFNQGGEREQRHTLGARFFGTLGRWDINDEAIYQFGQFGSGDINAWSVVTDHGYTLGNLWGQPRLGLRAAVASGDNNPNDTNLQTFNPLFVRGNYFSEAGLLSPQNFIDLYPTLRVKPIPQLIFDLGFDFHWRENLGDGIYRPGGSVIFRGNPDFARFVGAELVLGTAWQITRHISLSAAYSHFFAGEFIRQSAGEDADFGALWTTFKF